jgi:hypothetical protein
MMDRFAGVLAENCDSLSIFMYGLVFSAYKFSLSSTLRGNPEFVNVLVLHCCDKIPEKNELKEDSFHCDLGSVHGQLAPLPRA